MKPKTYLFTVILLFMFISSITAQRKYSFALKGGINQSKLNTGINNNSANLYTSSKDKALINYDFGLAFEYYFLPELSLYTSLEFSSKKSEIRLEEEFSPLVISMTRSYIQLPIHGNYIVKKVIGMNISIHGGPYVAYDIGGKIKIDGFPSKNDLKNISDKIQIVNSSIYESKSLLSQTKLAQEQSFLVITQAIDDKNKGLSDKIKNIFNR